MTTKYLSSWPVDYFGPELVAADHRINLTLDLKEELAIENVPQIENFSIFTYLWPTPELDPADISDANPLQQLFLVGAQVLYQQEWHLLGHARGELLYSLPLAPGEETSIEVLSWDRNIYRREQEITNDLEREVSENNHYKDSREVLREIKKTKKWYASGKGSVNIFDMVKVTADPGGLSSETVTLNRNAQQTITESTDAASNRLHNQHKTSISTTHEFGREDRVTRKLSNTNRCHPVTYHFYEVLRNYQVITKSATPAARPCLYLKQTPPILRSELLVEPYDYHGFLKALRWLHQNSHLLAQVLLDRSFYQGIAVLPKLVAYWSLRRGLAASGNFDDALRPVSMAMIAGAITIRAQSIPYLFGPFHAEIEAHAPWLYEAILTADNSLHAAVSSGIDGEITQAVDRLLSQFAQFYPMAPQHFRDLFESARYSQYLYQPLMALKSLFTKLVYGPAPGEDPEPAHLELMTEVAEAQRLMRHIESNHLHYFQAIWAAMDPGQRLLEASEQFLPWDNQVRLADVIEPVPLGFYADYAVFAYTGASDDSMVAELVQSFLDQADEAARETTVVLPTNGIVVEAQLGETNACEPFIREHRTHDLAVKAEEVRKSDLENQRRQRKLDNCQFDNPECCPGPREGILRRLWSCLCCKRKG